MTARNLCPLCQRDRLRRVYVRVSVQDSRERSFGRAFVPIGYGCRSCWTFIPDNERTA